MKIQTFSVVIGDRSCNANCPFCVSRITPSNNVEESKEPNWRNFEIGCKFAQNSGVSTVLLTGKGEPLLKKNIHLISKYLNILQKYNFPFIEVQTNGIFLLDIEESCLKNWYDSGLTTFSISCVDYRQEMNCKIYSLIYPDLKDVINRLHSLNFSVRLSCIMLKGYVESIGDIHKFAQFCKDNNVEQFTARSVSNNNVEINLRNQNIYNWIEKNKIEDASYNEIKKYFDENAIKLLDLMHGATVYDYNGQNICLSNCLTHQTDIEEVRQLIFFPDGKLKYSWTYEGATLL